jgi:hypothetical protein
MTTAAVAVSLPAFDLTNVVEQLSHKKEYYYWTPERFESAVLEYRKFLHLCKHNPEARLIPGRDVDTIWHRHMLNSRQYMEDCDRYFGYYLHHNPHSRIQAESQQANGDWVNTLELYEITFGYPPVQGWLNGQAICNGGCDSSKCGPG